MKLEIKNKNTKKFKFSFAQKGGRVDYDNQRKIGKRWFAKNDLDSSFIKLLISHVTI